MKAEKVLDYLMEENNIHYQHYYTMKEFMLGYQLPVSMLKTTDEPKALFDKLLLSYRNPPSTVDSRLIEDTSEFMEEIIKCNQKIRGFNERMLKEVMDFVNVYNNLIMDKLCKNKSNSPTSWNNMKDTMRRLMHNEEEWKAERDNLEGELFILSNEKSETEERELSALRTKVKLQKDLQCANKMISNLEKTYSCCEQKKKKNREKASLLKRILRFFYKKLKMTKQCWEEHDKRCFSQNMQQDMENSDEDMENSYNVIENEDEDTNYYTVMENGDEDTENSDEDTENSDEDTENSYNVMDNSDKDLEDSGSFIENSDDNIEKSDSSKENGDEDRGDMSKDIGELSFLKKQKSDMDHWSKEVEKQLEEARDFKRKYQQYIEVLEKEAEAIKKASTTHDSKSTFKNSAV